MRGVRALGDRAYRWWYYLSMYTGIRAWRNRWRSRGCGLDPRLLGLHGTRIDGEGLGEVWLWVHPRARTGSVRGDGRHGMISLQQVAPKVGRLTYAYLCLTGHFGRAHAEVAFYEEAGEVTVHGVRNIARANSHRLGLLRLAHQLRLADSREEERVLRLVSRALRRAGFAPRLAPATECVDLSVDERLLPPGNGALVRETLRRRYARLALPPREPATSPALVTATVRATAGAARQRTA
jgi:hypothetical protein